LSKIIQFLVIQPSVVVVAKILETEIFFFNLISHSPVFKQIAARRNDEKMYIHAGPSSRAV